MQLKGLKGVKGLTTIGVLLSAILIFVISIFFVIPAFAIHSLTSQDVVTEATSVNGDNVSTGQRLETLNFSFVIGGNGNVTNVLLNFSVIGNTAGNFSAPSSNNSVVCGGRDSSLTGWRATINDTAVTCYNSTQDGGARGTFNVSMINRTIGYYAPSVRGLYRFNITTTDNDTETNTTTVGVDVQLISANVTLNVTTQLVGRNESIQFTITHNISADRQINKIIINFTTAGFTAPVSVSCPPLGAGWGAATIGANDVICSTGGSNTLGSGASTTIILNGTAAAATGGVKNWDVIVYDTGLGPGANYTIAKATNISVSNLFGLLNITGTNMMPSTIPLNKNLTDNATQAARFNFSARGEQMNVTMITLLRTGTAADADILEVAIYNTTDDVAGGAYSIQNATLIAKTLSAPDSLGRYIFTGIGFNVSTSLNNFLLVAFNVSRSATGGRTVGFMINNTGNVTTTGGVSNVAITETLLTGASDNATIFGNLTITGTDVFAGAVVAGARNVSVVRYNFSARGEQMNVTQIVLTRMGTATDADIPRVALYNSSSDGLNVFTGNATLIMVNSTPDGSGRYNFTVGFNVTTISNQLLVVIDVASTAVATRTVGFFINGTGNVTTTSSVSGQSITETLVTTSSQNATISNFTITGLSTAPSTILLNKNGTQNITQFIRFNFSTRGEGVNITSITILRTGTVADADVLTVAIYNSTPAADTDTDPLSNVQLIARNTSPDSLGRYTFSSFQWNISNTGDSVDQYLYVVANLTREATGGRTLGFMINNTGNVTTTGAVSGGLINSTLLTGASDNATIVGNLTITGTDDLPGAIRTGATNVSVIRYNFSARGEQMNITQLNLTRTGTAADSDILAVGLYNSSSDGLNVFTANATLIAWNYSAPRADGTYNFTGLGFNVTTSSNQLLIVVNISSTAVAGRTLGFKISPVANITVTSAVSGQAITPTLVTTSTGNSTLGNFSIVGTNMMPATTFINRNSTDNATQAARFNFSARGEGVNITEINITRTGTAQNADILELAIYNTTPDVAGGLFSIENATLIAKNSSAPRADGTYTFRGIALNVSTALDQFVIIAFNVSRSATGGRTVGFMINNIANVSAIGAISNGATNATFVTGASDNATIVGNLTITGTNRIEVTIDNATTNRAVISYVFDVSGEQMNITQLNLTRTGTATTNDILAVGLFNSSSTDTDYSGDETLIAWNSSAPRADGTYNFTGLGFNVTTSDATLFIVINLTSSATGGNTIGFKLSPVANITVTSSVSNQAITPTLVTTSSDNATIVALSITGTDDLASTVTVGLRNVSAIRYNFSARGNTTNVTYINITRTGTATDADIQAVGLFNSSSDGANVFTANATVIAWNRSVPVDGVYNFSGLSVSVPRDRDNIILVVFNLTSGATGNRTLGAKINGTSRGVVSISAVNATPMTESLITTSTANATLVGNLSIRGIDVAATQNISIGSRNVSVAAFTFDVSGEGMNVTQLNLTLTGSLVTGDIESIALYNTSTSDDDVFNGTETFLTRNYSAPRADRTYNFTGIGWNITTGDGKLLVVVNMTAGSSTTGGTTIGFKISPAANVTVTSAVTNQAITATLDSTSTTNATVFGNLTITGTNRIASTVVVGTRNITVLSLNFTASGEQMNITEINLTRTGTVTDADVLAVGLVNGTNTTYIGNEEWLTVISWNSSAPRADGTYTFRGIAFNVSTALRGNILLVIVNLTSGSTANRTLGFKLSPAANITTTGSVSGLGIAENVVTTSSDNGTLVGNLTVTGNSVAPDTATAGDNLIGILNLTFRAAGENANVTSINITLRGNATTGNVTEVRLYNDSGATAGVLDSTDGLIPGARGVFAGGTLNITPTNPISIPSGTPTIIFVVYNITATQSKLVLGIGAQVNATIIAGRTAVTNISLSVDGTIISSINASFGGDNTPPAVNATAPANDETVTTQRPALLVNTTEATTCRYDTSDRAYALMANTFTADFRNLSHNYTLANQTFGTKTFYVRCQDFAGNAMTTSSVITFTITNLFTPTAPTSLAAVQVALTKQVNLSWTAPSGGADDGYVNAYRVYRANNASVSTSSTLVASLGNVTRYTDTVPADGRWNYTVTAVDSSGNEGTAATHAALNIDTTSPVITATAPTANETVTTQRPALLVNTSEDASCRFDSVDTTYGSMANTFTGTATTHNFTLPNQTFGTKTFYVRCSDTAGNNMTTSSVITFTITNQFTPTAPTSLSAVQVGASRQVNLSWTAPSGGADDGYVNAYRVYRANNASVGTGSPLIASLGNVTKYADTVPADSEWNYTVTAVDSSGNEGTAATAVSVRIDTTPPVINVTAPTAIETVTTQTPALLVNTSEDASCRFDTVDRAYGAMTNIFTGTARTHNYTLSNQTFGTKTFYVRCSDTAGNNMTTSSVITFTITNQLVPTAPTSLAVVQVALTRQVNLSWTAPSGGADDGYVNAYRVYRANNASVGTGSPLIASLGNVTKYTDTVSEDSRWNYTVTAVDSSGNEGTAATAAAITIDTTPPQITNITPIIGGSVTTRNPALIVNTSEGATCRFDNATSVYPAMANTFTGTGTTHNFTFTANLPDGINAFFIACADTLGNNMTGTSYWLNVDTTGNFNYTQSLRVGWNTLWIPQQSILVSFGRTAGNTGNFNFTSILSSLGSNWNYMYYNINDTSNGWVLATRTDPGGSVLKYVNNTNARHYWINMTATARFEL